MTGSVHRDHHAAGDPPRARGKRRARDGRVISEMMSSTVHLNEGCRAFDLRCSPMIQNTLHAEEGRVAGTCAPTSCC